MSAHVVSLLRRIGAGKLRTLAGETILAAIEKVAPAEVEKQIAQILLLKYGNSILNERTIRLALIDVLEETSSLRLCREVGRPAKNQLDANSILRDYFHGFGEKKSKQLVDFLGLGPEYCYVKQEDIRTSCETIRAVHGEQLAMRSYLHPYQKIAKDDILERLDGKGQRFIVQMPTGSGKTFTALEAVVDVLRRRRRRKYVIWIVDSNELAEQALSSFVYLWKVKGDQSVNAFRLYKSFAPTFEEEEGGVVFASFGQFHSIISNTSHASYQSLWRLIRNTELLIVDEAHTSVAPTYEECIRCFLNNDYTNVLGLSATPGRSDPESTQRLVSLYSNSLIGIRGPDGGIRNDAVGFLQQQGFLAQLDCKVLETGISVSAIEESAILSALAANAERNERILEQVSRANQEGLSTLVFACTLDHVLALSILCKSKGISAEYIIGNVDQARRLTILDRFKKREYFILINLDILSTGIDLPNVNEIIITRPIGSPILYSQILGRALRGPKNGGNESNTVITIKDNLANFPSANFIYTMFSLDWSATKLSS